MSLDRRPGTSVVSRLVLVCTLAAAAWLAGSAAARGQAPLVPGRNVNMVAGTKWPDGDPYLQRQNEPSVAASTRNPLHLLAGANDYRSVDIPFVNNADETGDAWLGLFKSFDGGQRWRTSLLPGYPQDTSPAGMQSPLKGYQAGADPVVRAGTNGLLYYSGLVFDRTEDGTGRSAIFVARFVDNNDREAGDPIRYLGTSMVASSPGGATSAFLDKPWLAVDIPRGNAGVCRIVTTDVDPVTNQTRTITQTVPAGPAYVAYTAFTRDAQGERADIYFTRSTNCGATWSTPIRVNRLEDRVNQGATLAIDPRDGDVFIAWRQFAPTAAAAGDGLMVARYHRASHRCLPPGLVRKLHSQKFANILDRIREKRRGGGAQSVGQELESFDQATTDITNAISFRTNAYPTLAIDGSSRLYMAWTERGFGTARPSQVDGDARIVMATSGDGRTWTTPQAVADETTTDNQPIPGHQIMPTLTVGGGRLVLVYYDLRDDVSQQFSQFADDRVAIQTANRRRTLDLRASFAAPGANPAFAPSVRVSDYLVTQEITPAGTVVERQLQFNAPNLPMFKQGTAPFMGDYVDVTTVPAFVPTTNGRWAYNTAGQAVFHAVWTDNRDVRQPTDLNGDGNPWNDYAAPSQRAGGASIFDPTKTMPVCDPLNPNTGSRNQNIYTARLSAGLVVGSPGNTKPLSPSLQRGFSVFAQNTTSQTKTFRMTITNQPPGGRASFDQFAAQPLVSVDVTTAPRSLAARTVYMTSSQPDARVSVTVREIAGVGGAVMAGGLSDVIILNPDIANPDIANPDIANPDIANPDIANAEVYNPDIANPDIANPDIANPDIANPDIANPDIANPDIANPDIANPDIANVQVANPDIANPDIANPDIANPDIANPDIANPDIANPDIANTTLTDVSWTITNNGNTAASFNVNLFLAQATNKICGSGQTPTNDGCIATQLVLHKLYSTPTATGCEVQVQTQNVLIASIPNPRFVMPGTGAPSANDPSVDNATLWLAPGESAKITLRIADPNTNDNSTVGAGATIDPVFFPTASGQGGVLTPFVTQQAVNSTSIGPGGTVTRYPASVFFVQQPTTTPFGFPIAPPVSVQVRDQLGSPLANASVTMTLQNPAPGAATVSGGDATTTDANGVAVFPSLLVDRAGAGYRLEVTVIDASATTVGSISNVSVPFDVPLAVVNVNDAGAGSLRFALEQSNLTLGLRETIVFAIPGAGPHTIAPASELPAIIDPVVVDARTQSGYAPLAPAVTVTGANIPGPLVGPALLDVTAGNTELRGLFVHGSGASGIRVRGNGVQVRDNVVSASFASGVVVQGGTGNTIAGNVIGLSPGGLLPALPNAIGVEITDTDGAPAEGTVVDGNIVSGNSSAGILLRSAGGGPVNTAITGNLVGLDVSGSIMAGNGNLAELLGGIFAEAGPGTTIGAPGAGNSIGGNFGAGITLGTQLPPSVAAGVTVVGNYIGTNSSNVSLGNTLGGIRVLNGAANLIGGDAQVAGTENVIHNNGGAGVAVIGGSGNAVRFNSISGNAGQGIDLGGDGIVNANDGGGDADFGPNGLQNHPALLWARNNVVPGATTVRGTFSSSPMTTFRIRIYSSAVCDAGGFGEGERQEDTFVVSTGGTGGAAFQQELAGPTVAGPLPLGLFVTVTATPLDGPDAGSTSEFSNCVPVEDLSGFEVRNTNDSGTGSLRQALLNANAAPDANVVTFAIPGASAAAPAVIALLSPLPTITTPVSIDATTQPGWSPSFGFRPIVEVNGAGAGGSSLFNVHANGVAIHGLALTKSAGDGIFVLQGVASASIRYNAIGTDRTGSAGKGNAGIGIRFRGHSGSIQSNVISGNGGPGVLFEDLGDGGSANDNTGDNNTVSDNVIGLNPDALAALPNTNGIVMYDGTNNNTITTNTIGGNAGWGIDIQQSGGLKAVAGTQILSNRIGVSPSLAPLPNGNGGVRLTDTTGTVVGSAPGTANVIAFNGGPGVVIANGALGVSAGNQVSFNAIHNNAGLGIDLGGDGVTPNDAGDGDTGPNGLQNAPVLTASANVGTSSTALSYSFSGAPNTQYALEFFTNAACDPSGSGEGQTLAFTDLVTTDGAGNFSRSDWPVGGYFPYGISFTATARNSAAGNTSEFSNCLPHVEPAPVGPVTGSAGGAGGSPFGPLYCPAGQFAVGFRVATTGPPNTGFGYIDYALTSAALLCSDGSTTPQFGGTTTPNANLTCGPGEVMVGFFGATTGGGVGGVVGSVGARCQSLTGGPVSQTGALPGVGASFGPLDCPTGQAVIGVQGRQGAVVDQTALVCGAVPTSALITSASPSVGAAGQGFIVLRGLGLPLDQAIVTSGSASAAGFVFMSPSTPTAAWVRLPFGFPTGPAQIRLRNAAGTVVTNSFPLTVAATPGTPVITGVFGPSLAPTTTVSAGGSLFVAADGIDTTGATVRFEQDGNTWDVTPASTGSNASIGVAASVTAPAGLNPLGGPVSVSVRQGAGAFSAPVVLTVQ